MTELTISVIKKKIWSLTKKSPKTNIMTAMTSKWGERLSLKCDRKDNP